MIRYPCQIEPEDSVGVDPCFTPPPGVRPLVQIVYKDGIDRTMYLTPENATRLAQDLLRAALSARTHNLLVDALHHLGNESMPAGIDIEREELMERIRREVES